MIVKNKIVAKYYFLIVLTLWIFFIAAFFSYAILMKNINAKSDAMAAPLFIAKVLDILDPKNKISAIKKFIALQNPDNSGPTFALYNQRGEIVYPDKSPAEKISPDVLHSLPKAYDNMAIRESGHLNSMLQSPIFKQFTRMRVFLIRLQGEPAYYLKIYPTSFTERKVQLLLSLILGFAMLFIAILLGVAASFFLIYLTIAKHTRMADKVISDLQNGNLKARFAIHRNDEVGQAMKRFNKMADEIERLVMCLMKDEKARINLLQELTHDLKTPIASLKMLLETLDNQDASLDGELKKELINLSRKEVDYFARLIDDLLLLAQVSEPKYQVQKTATDISQILNEEIYDSDFRKLQQNTNIKILKNFPDQIKYVHGDSHLLRRLFRNAFDNAISFSRNNITIDLQSPDEHKLKIIIQDDGPGFSEESLKFFGERRLNRKINNNDRSRVSFGLGSVIMKAICQLHGGTLTARNLLNNQLEIIGASLEIEFFCENVV